MESNQTWNIIVFYHTRPWPTELDMYSIQYESTFLGLLLIE